MQHVIVGVSCATARRWPAGLSGSEWRGSTAKVVCHLVSQLLVAAVIGWPDATPLSGGAAGSDSCILTHYQTDCRLTRVTRRLLLLRSWLYIKACTCLRCQGGLTEVITHLLWPAILSPLQALLAEIEQTQLHVPAVPSGSYSCSQL